MLPNEEIYSETEFIKKYRSLYDQIKGLITLKEYYMSQAIAFHDIHGAWIMDVVYVRKDNEDTTAYFEFDSNLALINWEEETLGILCS